MRSRFLPAAPAAARPLAFTLALAFALALGIAWASEPVLAQAPAAAPSSDSGREAIDAFGQRFSIGEPPTRIVSLSPSLTEALFAIGVPAQRIVGVTRFCDFPEEARSIEKVGGIVDPSIETILSLHPDLVLVTRGNPMPVIDRLRAAGLPVFAIDAEGGLDQVLQSMRTLIRVAQPSDPQAAGEAVERLAGEAERLRARSARYATSDRPTVYYYDCLLYTS
ncbi:MAG: helical backbone metal receptor, partial [Candidatus Eisenbacteria bacterium]|nr:helical backbone metal receptor [Candidatus Eisenbacteria bacterium]